MDTRQQHYLKLPLVRTARWHGPLLALAGVMGLSLLIGVVGMIVDDRVATGMPIWIKPIKFSLSIGIYALTTAYLIPLLRKGKRTAWWLGAVSAVMLLTEMLVIDGQAFRGTTSHFNTTTDLNAFLWVTMGVAITIMWFANLVIAAFVARTRIGDRVLSRALRWGLSIAAAGMAIGYLMARQDTSDLEGVAGAHTIGRADGGPSMPFLGWSTVSGDLRISHFVGMHAMQALPLLAMGLAWLATRRMPRLADEGLRARIVLVVSLAYAGLVGLVFWQAMRGESLIHPGTATLAGFAALVVATVVGMAVAVRVRTPVEPRQPVNVS